MNSLFGRQLCRRTLTVSSSTTRPLTCGAKLYSSSLRPSGARPEKERSGTCTAAELNNLRNTPEIDADTGLSRHQVAQSRPRVCECNEEAGAPGSRTQSRWTSRRTAGCAAAAPPSSAAAAEGRLQSAPQEVNKHQTRPKGEAPAK